MRSEYCLFIMPVHMYNAILFILLSCLTGNALALKTGPLRKQKADMVVIHSTGGPTCDTSTGKMIWVKAGTLSDNLRNIEANPRLGIHFMIDRDGTVATSIRENQIAHHVYKYSPRSIAIELINDGDGRDPFPEFQMDVLIKLLREIVQRQGIDPAGIKRHSDLDHGMLKCARSQRRKVDPGDSFPYQAVLDRVYGTADQAKPAH